MIRVVLDTNIVVSGVFWSGASFRVLQLADERLFVPIVSLEIVKEYRRVIESKEILAKTSRASTERALVALQRLLLLSHYVRPKGRVRAVAEDPDDDKFLDAAMAGQASCLVSMDKHILRLKNFRGISILEPSSFLEQMQKLKS